MSFKEGRDKFKCYKTSDPLTKYTSDHSLRLTAEQNGLLEATLSDPLFEMVGDPETIQLITNLMKLIKAKKVLEVGTYTGFGTLAAALAIPEDGQVFTLDITDKHFSLGKPFIEKAGVFNKVKLILGDATETLETLVTKKHTGTFDFAFIDANKSKMKHYYEKCLTLIRPGGIVAIDNTLWNGDVLNEKNLTEDTIAIKEFNKLAKDDPRIDISFLRVGDGVTLCFKK